MSNFVRGCLIAITTPLWAGVAVAVLTLAFPDAPGIRTHHHIIGDFLAVLIGLTMIALAPWKSKDPTP